MKKISIVVPCYNEEKSVHKMHQIITDLFATELKNYDYELIFVDDLSPDNTRAEIEKICAQDKKTKAVFNAKNFGYTRNVFQSLLYGDGDATFMFFGDMQDPPQLLPQFVEKWEQGKKVIIGQKINSSESKILFFLRTMYYKVVKRFSSVKQVSHFNGYGLYDREFIDVLRQIDDSQPYLKGIVGEFAMKQEIIQYEQSIGMREKSNVNFGRAYDAAMIGITSYTKTFMRMATFVGAGLGVLSGLFAMYIFLSKLLNWNTYPYGTASIIIGVFFIGAVQLFFTGILGEYILSINTRTMRRPLVVVEKKINFDEDAALK
ncbi:MAG: glycosyltransferase family 2 protein [Hydrogenoanaerobacterium sp.]